MKNIIKKYIIICLFFNCTTIYAQSVSINAIDYRQTIDMMGGDMERSSNAVQTTVINKDEVINWGFNDINFNYCRVQFDKNQELTEGVKNFGFYDNQITSMQAIKAINPDIRFYATMRSDYDGFGDNNNMPDWIVNYETRAVQTDNYALFLADYLEFMHDNDVTIHTLSLAKEWVSYVPADVAAQIINRLNTELANRNVPQPEIIDPATWSINAGINYLDDVSALGTEGLYSGFSSHDYNNRGDLWADFIQRGVALGKKVYDDETGAGGGPTGGQEIDVPVTVYAKKAVAYEAGLNGEIFFEIWSRGLNNETRAIYWPRNGTARRLRAYYIMQHFANNVLNKSYITSTVNSAPDVSTMAFRSGDQIIMFVINAGTTSYSSMQFNLNGAQFNSSVSNTYWNNDSAIEGTNTNQDPSNTSFNASIEAGSINAFTFNVENSTNTSFIPDPSKTYYIDSPFHNLRLASTGSSENAYTTSTETTGDDVEWKFISNGSGYWHLERAAGGTKPRLRSDNTQFADMNENTAIGSWTYFNMTQGASDQTYFLTLPHGPTDYKRLQIDNTGSVNMVPNSYTGTWVSFEFTEATNIVHIKKRNATDFSIDGNSGASNGLNIHLWSENENNRNQQWLEIDRGNGYYTYQKIGTEFCIDGGNGGENRQNVYLWQCSDNNQNQHWKKTSTDSGFFKLVKRNASGFAINGGSNGENGQNVNLFNSSNTSHNLQWSITPID